MDKKLKGILDILNELNSNINIVNQKDFNEQYDNLGDFKNLTGDLNDLLNRFELVNKYDGEEVDEVLAEFHRIITTFEWHFSEISDLNMKIFELYKDRIRKV